MVCSHNHWVNQCASRSASKVEIPESKDPVIASSTTAMIVLFWSRATRDLLRSFGWGIAALHRENTATKCHFLRRSPHSIYGSLSRPSRSSDRDACKVDAVPTFLTRTADDPHVLSAVTREDSKAARRGLPLRRSLGASPPIIVLSWKST